MDVNDVLLPGVGPRHEFTNAPGDQIGMVALAELVSVPAFAAAFFLATGFPASRLACRTSRRRRPHRTRRVLGRDHEPGRRLQPGPRSGGDRLRPRPGHDRAPAGSMVRRLAAPAGLRRLSTGSTSPLVPAPASIRDGLDRLSWDAVCREAWSA
ncbi:hypothetical protein ACIRG5_24625 [Lentzea sp. NPDC102401]|uniref:hypothetical protein n=1 Tax=Lentzea sp. NPDC102401 TaxID=3364128 RepID=UPI0037FC9B49